MQLGLAVSKMPRIWLLHTIKSLSHMACECCTPKRKHGVRLSYLQNCNCGIDSKKNWNLTVPFMIETLMKLRFLRKLSLLKSTWI